MRNTRHIAMPALYEWVRKCGSYEKAANILEVTTLSLWEWCTGVHVMRDRQKVSRITGIPTTELVSDAECRWKMNIDRVELRELYNWIYAHGNIQWFADKIHVDRSTVRRWVTGKTGISVGMMARVMRCTGLPMSSLIRKGEVIYDDTCTDA